MTPRKASVKDECFWQLCRVCGAGRVLCVCVCVYVWCVMWRELGWERRDGHPNNYCVLSALVNNMQCKTLRPSLAPQTFEAALVAQPIVREP